MEKNDKKLLRETETAKMLEDVDLEWSIVAYLSNAPFEHIQEVREKIKTEYFYHDAPRHIYQLICWFNDKGENVTPMLLQPEIMRRGKVKIEEFTKMLAYSNTFPSYIDLLNHIPLLVDYAKRRRLWLVGQKMIKEGTCVGAEFSRVAEEVKGQIDDILYDSVSNKSMTMRDILCEIQDIVDGNQSGQVSKIYSQCGFQGIDEKSGLSRGDLDIIAASSSVGKTSMAVSMTINLINQGKNVAYFSTEMSPVMISARILSAYTKLYSSTILKRKMTEMQMTDFNKGMTDVYEASSHLFFHENNTTNFNLIVQCIRKLHAEHNIEGAFVDFIQRLTGQEKSESKFEFYARVAQVLKDLAKELNIWIVALSQITDEEFDKNLPPAVRFLPSVNKLKGSSEIFDAADNVWLIHRPSVISKKRKIDIDYPPPFQEVVTENTAMVMIGKGRNDGTGEFIIGFDPNTTHFYDLKEPPYKGLTEQQAESAKSSLNPILSIGLGTSKRNNSQQNDLPF